MPNYRQGFDVYDASTGIEEDISKVVIKDGEVMPGWTDEDIPSVAHDRAVIPGNVNSAVFYLMMADEDLKGHPPHQEIDAPDVFTDQPHILAVTMAGTAASGGVVDPQEMLMLQLDFHCHQVQPFQPPPRTPATAPNLPPQLEGTAQIRSGRRWCVGSAPS
jgi:hypothetical protein